ncbi:unnamed protein product [Lepeophtheirus salmonis]|uniref:(salmon louse) hypothetical protein n=1 Tax=Lepeophtheirus salmonis TaxID=72036 RepID=A0A0K2UC84_LEPSM|nr:unnamed protein product [Lepeophtheirus salmonis]CAF2959457.1 unnamed protein product [Lepeophtheirus salmonis]
MRAIPSFGKKNHKSSTDNTRSVRRSAQFSRKKTTTSSIKNVCKFIALKGIEMLVKNTNLVVAPLFNLNTKKPNIQSSILEKSFRDEDESNFIFLDFNPLKKSYRRSMEGKKEEKRHRKSFIKSIHSF